MQRPIAAVGEDGEVLGFVATCAQLGGDAVGHAGVHLLFDKLADLDEAQVQFVAELFLNRLLRATRIERNTAVCVVLGVEVAEQQVGIGHSRLEAATVIACRPRIGARRLRTDFDGLVHAIDTARSTRRRPRVSPGAPSAR